MGTALNLGQALVLQDDGTYDWPTEPLQSEVTSVLAFELLEELRYPREALTAIAGYRPAGATFENGMSATDKHNLGQQMRRWLDQQNGRPMKFEEICAGVGCEVNTVTRGVLQQLVQNGKVEGKGKSNAEGYRIRREEG
jgi:hypothetical protein